MHLPQPRASVGNLGFEFYIGLDDNDKGLFVNGDSNTTLDSIYNIKGNPEIADGVYFVKTTAGGYAYHRIVNGVINSTATKTSATLLESKNIYNWSVAQMTNYIIHTSENAMVTQKIESRGKLKRINPLTTPPCNPKSMVTPAKMATTPV